MLSHIQVKDFTLVDNLELELHEGLTALTGETGAGKSILLDALGLAMGDRADTGKIRQGATRADINATFDIAHHKRAQQWLKQHNLVDEEVTDDELADEKANPASINEVILRRTITSEGRSRAYINGHTVPLAQLRTLGEMLLNIHSQHEHQSLLQSQTHKYSLDAFGQLDTLRGHVNDSFNTWHQLKRQHQTLQDDTETANARYQLLKYQVEELDALDITENEIDELEKQQQQLANAEQLIGGCQALSALCDENDDSIHQQLHQALHHLKSLTALDANLTNVADMLETAKIQVQEAASELQRCANTIETDDSNLQEIEQRLSTLYEVARKHRVRPEELYALHQSLSEELSSLQSGDEQIAELEAKMSLALENYQQHASKLSQGRQAAAKKLVTAVTKQLKLLSMEHARFDVCLDASDTPTKHGNETVEFLISTLPGKAAQALHKVASGGELSRVSLAIQVVLAKTATIPTLIFDEVDVGIGGTTGNKVGQLLRELGQATQVICVTHLAQVASKAHHHLKVNKTLSKKAVNSTICVLEGEDKVSEIARMMGGDIASDQSLAHAREMVEGAA